MAINTSKQGYTYSRMGIEYLYDPEPPAMMYALTLTQEQHDLIIGALLAAERNIGPRATKLIERLQASAPIPLASDSDSATGITTNPIIPLTGPTTVDYNGVRWTTANITTTNPDSV